MTTSITQLTIQQPRHYNPDRLIEQALNFETAMYSALEEVGERFGLYHIMLHNGPITPACLATQAGITEGAARVWLEAQAAGGYLSHCGGADLYCLWSPWPRWTR
jgi:hypothetical protein